MTQATYRVLLGDALEQLRTLPDGSVQTCVTSPPYFGLRDYGAEGQIGLEPTPAEYVARLVAVFREVKRVLRDDGTLWCNLGDSYATDPKGPNGADKSNLAGGGDYQHATTPPGLHGWDYRGSGFKRKDLLGIPWRVAFALQDDGWYLRSDIIWAKPNGMPESVTDRPTRSHEYIFLLSKARRYYYDADAIKEPVQTGDNGSYFDKGKTARHTNQGKDRRPKRGPGDWGVKLVGIPGENANRGQSVGGIGEHVEMKNKRDVWTVATKPYAEAHFAVFPEELIEPMILAGCPEGGTVLDPFAGSGTTLAVANRLGRHAIGIELNSEYLPLIEKRCRQGSFVFAEG